jgi:energy-coupling factor transport system permease protein
LGPRGAPLHPGAWWGWALGLALGAALTTNPLILVLIAAAALAVCLALRTDAPWAMSLRLYLFLAGFVLVMRLVFRVVFGAGVPGAGDVLFDLPVVRLPGLGSTGLALLGPVTWDALYGGLMDGLRLGCLILCVGVANCLASPKQTLAALPAAFRHVGTAVVVALSVFPSLALAVQRVRRVQRLRATGAPGVKVPARQRLRRIVFPVLADSLDRSLALAASLESRGYGSDGPARSRGRATSSGTIVGCTLLGGGAVLTAAGRGGALGPVVAVLGLALVALSVWSLGRSSRRTRYRRQPWTWRDWSVVASGGALCLALWAATAVAPGSLQPSVLGWPPLPWPAVLGWAAACLPLAIGLGPRPAASSRVTPAGAAPRSLTSPAIASPNLAPATARAEPAAAPSPVQAGVAR